MQVTLLEMVLRGMLKMSKSKQKQDEDVIKKIVVSLEQVGELLGVHPTAVTRSELINNSDITDYFLRKGPSLNQIKNTNWPYEKDYAARYLSSKANSHISKLERKLGEKSVLEKVFTEQILKNIKPIKVKPYRVKSKSVKKQKRHVVAMLNDLHIGLKVEPKEVGGLNEFNFNIASRRVAYYINQVCNYKKHKRNEVETLHLILNGDMIHGAIHGLLGNDLELMVHQFNGAVHILAYAIANLATEFKSVKVYGLGGNHEDHVHRREHGKRVLSQTFDNIESQIFYAVSAAHTKTPNVEFITTKDVFLDIDLPKGRAVATHGHLMFSGPLGNPGTNLNSKGLGIAIAEFNASQRRMSKEEAKLILLGHTHTHFHITTRDNVEVYNAPSLSGIDSYAYSIGITSNLVGQVLFESTEEYMMGDNRLVRVDNADKDASMDKIIPPYEYELTFKK